MAVRELDSRPEAYAHFPDNGVYRWLELHGDTVYGHAAFAERGDVLELHLSLHRWGAGVRRGLAGDLAWLKQEAGRLGKTRIMGIRANGEGEFDGRLFRFARLFGFTEMHVFQTASLDV
jgi:hypothetical protein